MDRISYNIDLLALVPFIAGLEVLTPVVKKSSVFWDMTLCSPLKVNRRFGETCHLHFQDCWFLACIILQGHMFFGNVG
jgi:hypothetical protein